MEEWIKKMRLSIYLSSIMFSHEKEGNPAIYYNMYENTIWYHLCSELKKKREREKQRIKIEWWVSQARGRGKWSDVGQRIQIFSYKNKFWGANVRHGTLVNNVVFYTWKLLKVDLKDSHFTQRKELTMLTRWGDEYVSFLDLCNHSATYMYIRLSCCTL